MQPILALLFIPALAGLAVAHARPAELDSTQMRALKDAEYYLKDFERALKPIVETANQVEQGSLVLDEIQLERVFNQMKLAGLKLGNAFKYSGTLPQDDPAVVAFTKRGEALAQQLLDADKILKGVQKATRDAIDNVGDIDGDVGRLQALSRRINNPNFLREIPERELLTVRDLPQMIAYRTEMEKRYGPILAQHAGRPMKDAIDGFDYNLAKYQAEMDTMVSVLPASVRAELEQAQTICDTSVERRRAQTFTEGILDATFQRAEVRLDLLKAISGTTAETRRLSNEKSAVEKRIASAARALEEDILRSNSAPNDLYTGGDKAEILALVEEQWKKDPVGKAALGMRIPMRAWERNEGIRWAHDQFQLHDFSELQVAIGVQGDAETVHVYYAHLEKDHMKGDTIRVRIDSKGEVPLYRKVLLENWK